MTENPLQKNNSETLTIIVDFGNIRIDKFLSNYFINQKDLISRNLIQQMISEEKILLNGKPVKKPSIKVFPNDQIDFPVPVSERTTNIKPVKMDLEIIYEDNDLLVINKPYNLVVHPAEGHHNDTLVNGLLYYLNGNLPNPENNFRPGIVHRLDKDTSGLMIVAKSTNAFLKLQKMIKNREVNRIYFALVHGNLKNSEARIETPFG
ncbi:MAG: RluA family pseudouridine synthase, partial [bacterium]|nr:RluA family pseudouridine synthase [bacterium]